MTSPWFSIVCCLITIVSCAFVTVLSKKSSLSSYRGLKCTAQRFREMDMPKEAARCEAHAAKALRHAWPFEPQPEEASR